MKRRLTAALSLAVAFLPIAAHAQFTDDAIRIGVLSDKLGMYSGGPGKMSIDAAHMAIEEVGGKVLEKSIEVIGADHQNSADIGAAVARAWFDKGVDAVFDLSNSAVALAVQGLAQHKNRVTVTSGAATTRLTGDSCSPTGMHWTFDSYSNIVGTTRALLRTGVKDWFLVSVDNGFGRAVEAEVTREVEKAGGKVLGKVRHPPGAGDLTPYLKQAQASKAKAVVLGSAGSDTINAIKQAAKLGIATGGQTLVGLIVGLDDVHALGLETTQGLAFTAGWYWDLDDQTRAFGQKFYERNNHMPGMTQAGIYSAVLHYLKAVQAAGTDEAKAVVAKMKETPVNDAFARNGKIRDDGRMVHDMLLVQVKKPAESKKEWDYLKVLATTKGDDAFRTLADSDCPLVRK